MLYGKFQFGMSQDVELADFTTRMRDHLRAHFKVWDVELKLTSIAPNIVSLIDGKPAVLRVVEVEIKLPKIDSFSEIGTEFYNVVKNYPARNVFLITPW
ncbi:hypothetical protein FJY84_03320 [Candidatus Bathyarchaeota archaeon]|nr:hypothetical protein [Candidatus Bathyarchaeota archaeon]